MRPTLTPRQQSALDLLIAHGPLLGRQMGALMHAQIGRHSADETCGMDERNGVGVLKELRAKGYAKLRTRASRHHAAGWYAVTAEGRPVRPPSDDFGEIPF